MGLTLNDVLSEFDAPETEKVAAQAPKNATGVDTAVLQSYLKQAEAELSASASAGSPSDSLEKMAAQLAADEQELLIKEASMYGAALADAFVSRIAMYDAGGKTEKTAADVDEEFARGVIEGYEESLRSGHSKTAAAAEAELSQYDPALVKAASEVIDGYNAAKAEMAQREYNESAEKTAAHLDNVAADCYRRGYEDCDRLLRAMA